MIHEGRNHVTGRERRRRQHRTSAGTTSTSTPAASKSPKRSPPSGTAWSFFRLNAKTSRRNVAVYPATMTTFADRRHRKFAEHATSGVENTHGLVFTRANGQSCTPHRVACGRTCPVASRPITDRVHDPRLSLDRELCWQSAVSLTQQRGIGTRQTRSCRPAL